MKQPAVWAVVPAAGVGSRMASPTPKQYLPLHHQPVIVHTLQRLCSVEAVQGVWVGIAESDNTWAQIESQFGDNQKCSSYRGGAERAHTVLNGLNVVLEHADAEDWVLVHDAARPCVRIADINKLLSDVMESRVDGGILGLPVSDTVKRVDENNIVTETVDRGGLWRALTPQMFRLGQLKDALERALASGAEITDEASAMEFMGVKPLVVWGQADNIKITLPEDLALAELYLTQQQRHSN